jgi:hypothetical protein
MQCHLSDLASRGGIDAKGELLANNEGHSRGANPNAAAEPWFQSQRCASLNCRLHAQPQQYERMYV